MNAKESFVYAVVGTPAERIEDLRLLRGEGRYLDDLHRDRMLHAAILRSSIPHGRILRVDGSAAMKYPGVRAVYTAADVGLPVPRIPMRLEPLPGLQPFLQPVIANGKVRYVGEPIAVLVADSPELAEDALDAISVEIEPLPAVVDRDNADAAGVFLFEGTAGTDDLGPGTPKISTNCAFTFLGVRGDADTAFAAAPYTRKERFQVQRHTAMTMEMRGLLAEWDGARGRLTVHGASKVAFDNRRYLAAMLGLGEDAIDMIEVDVGGAFGVRGEFYPEDFLIPFAARRLGRPVKWAEDRREHMLSANHARDAGCELEIACSLEGRILGLRGRARTDIGAYIRTNGSMASRNIAQVSTGPYWIEHVKYEVSLMLTNKTPVGTYRGPGRFETDFFRERLLDIAAADLGIDRVEFRRRNLVPPEAMPYQLVTLVPGGDTLTDSGDYRVTLDRCLEEFGWTEKSALNGRLIDGRHHGIGVGCYLEGGGIGPRENARMVMEADGRIAVHVGSSGNGQGLETVIAQIAADALGVPMARIRAVYHGSTSDVREGFGSYSSRSVVMAGSAVLDAAKALSAAINAAAAKRLGCSADEIRIEKPTPADELYTCTSSGKSVRLMELLADSPIAAEGKFETRKRTYSYGAHAAHVAVDARTGHVEVLDYFANEDVGRIINPETLHGQTTGAIVQGLGGVFLEHLVYDEHGQLLTGSLADYMLPTAGDFPNIRSEAFEMFPSPNNPLGAKGAGEGGIIPVGGVIANAVAAALQSFGAKPNRLPLSPPRVWEMVNAAVRARSDA